MDAFKEAAFCRRLTTFHETFAPAGHSSASKPVISAIWHEAVANRKATKVCGAIMKLLTSPTWTQTESTAILSSGLITAVDKIKTTSSTRCSTLLFILSSSSSTKSLLSTLLPDTASFHAAVERSIKRNPVLLNIG